MAKAFDTVWIKGKIYKLNKKGVVEKLLAILPTFLKDRDIETWCSKWRMAVNDWRTKFMLLNCSPTAIYVRNVKYDRFAVRKLKEITHSDYRRQP